MAAAAEMNSDGQRVISAVSPSVKAVAGLVGFKLSRRFPAAANFVRPTDFCLCTLQCRSLSSSMLEMGSRGNARVVYGRNLSQIPLIFQASPHHPHPRRRTYFNIYGTVTAALGLGRREGGDIAEGKASTERITICHLF